MRNCTISIVIGLLIVTMFGCQSKEDKALLQRVKEREAAKSQLLQSPSKFIMPGKWDVLDKGIINTYTKATAIEFTNNSTFDVDEITGSIAYMDATEKVMATVPFTATGTIRAGQSVKLPVQAREITGKARKASIRVERVHIIGQ